MSQAIEIIRRCTRDGHTQWQNVANALGMTIERAKAEFEHIAKSIRGEKA